MNGVTKIGAARRQLDTAIDMFFEQIEPLAVYTVAYASFKLLLDMYPHHRDDAFSDQLDSLIGKEGWQQMSKTANFLKHADRDHDAVLEDMHALRPMGIIGFGTLLYRRITGEFSPKMVAFDFWVEEDGYEELGVVEIDEDVERAAAFKGMRGSIRALPIAERLKVARTQYQHFLENRERIMAEVEAARSSGKSFMEAFDEKFTNQQR